MALVRERAVDHATKLGERLRPHHEHPVDDESGCPVDTAGSGDRGVSVDDRRMAVVVERALEARELELLLARIIDERVALEPPPARLIFEEQRAISPKAGVALLPKRLDRGLGGEVR